MRPITRLLSLALAAAVPMTSAVAQLQHPIDKVGVGDTSIFAPVNLPTPNEIRLGSGAPGPRYWQNRR